jgi:hypothetical protein
MAGNILGGDVPHRLPLLVENHCGSNQLVSSMVPTVTFMKPGRAEFSPNSRLPHVGQKWRVLMLPLSAFTANILVSPLIETSSRLKRAFEMWPVPVVRWQSLQ